MSSKRQVRSFGLDAQLGRGAGFRTHAHPLHQATWAADGSLCIGAGGASWLLARDVALWIPAAVDHDVLAERSAVMRSLYFVPDQCPIEWNQPTTVDTSGLVGHLLDHLVETDDAAHRRLVEQVLFDVLRPVSTVTVRVPEPRDDRARRVAEALRTNPADNRTLDEWGRQVGASGRTLARAFQRDTGTGFARWRTQLRIAHAARGLASGRRVTEVALDVGYATPSAFVAAFRRVVGVAPGAYASARRDRTDATSEDRSDVSGVPVTVLGPGDVVALSGAWVLPTE